MSVTTTNSLSQDYTNLGNHISQISNDWIVQKNSHIASYSKKPLKNH